MSRIYIGQLSSRTRERDVQETFERFGRIRRIDMKNGYAFLEYDDSRDADDAVYEMHGKNLDGHRIRVEVARGSGSSSRDSRGGRGGRDDKRSGEGRCFNCGKDGHWARDCPDEIGRDKCFNCGRTGHLARECRERRGANPLRHVRPSSRSRSRSPHRSRLRTTRRSPSPKKSSYSRSPRRKRYSRSPRRDSRSPRRDSRSPRRDSRSPRRDSRSPRRESRSPRNRSYSRSPRNSRSPRGRAPRRSNSPPKSDKILNRDQSKSPKTTPPPLEQKTPPVDNVPNNNTVSPHNEWKLLFFQAYNFKLKKTKKNGKKKLNERNQEKFFFIIFNKYFKILRVWNIGGQQKNTQWQHLVKFLKKNFGWIKNFGVVHNYFLLM